MAGEKEHITDPAKELHALAVRLTRHKDNGTNIIALSKIIEVAVDQPEFLDVIAAVQRRVMELINLAKNANDADFSDEMRRQVVAAAQAFLSLFHPASANANWERSRNERLTEPNILALMFFSQTAQRHKPLRLIPEAEREAALSRLREAKQTIGADQEQEDWERTILLSGLDSIETVLRHLPFFGHDAAITKLLLIHAQFSNLERRETGKSKRTSIMTALQALSVAANLFLLPSQAATALDDYRNWTNVILMQIASEGAPRQLPPPSNEAIKPEPPEPEATPDSKVK